MESHISTTVMNNLKHVLILFFVFFVFLHSETFGFLFERDRVLVKTQSGVVSGIQRNNFYFFGGIPYAVRMAEFFHFSFSLFSQTFY